MTIEYLRQFRIGGYAIFDFAVSYLGIYLLAPTLSKLFLKIGLKIQRKNWMFLMLPVSIVIHLFFGAMTQMTQDFLDPQGHFFIKIIVLGSLGLGLRGIKRVRK